MYLELLAVRDGRRVLVGKTPEEIKRSRPWVLHMDTMVSQVWKLICMATRYKNTRYKNKPDIRICIKKIEVV